MRSLLEQVDPNTHLRDLFVPVYLAKVAPESFRTAGFEIDARIPPQDFANIERAVSAMIHHWSGFTRLFITEGDMMGTGYVGAQQGDLVCILYGSPVPYILHQTSDGRYIMIGPCHVDGLMFGEGLQMGLAEQDFILV